MGSTTKADSATSIRLKGGFLSLLVALVALWLVLLAWPRVQASLLFLPIERAISEYRKGETITSDEIERLKAQVNRVLEIQEHARFRDGLSLLYYMEANTEDLALYRRREAFESSIEQARLSLARAPVQPQLWLRIAHAENWLSFSSQGSVDAFKMSVLTSRVEPNLFLSRLLVGFQRIGALDEEGLGLLSDQVMLTWQMRRPEFIRAVKTGQLNRELILSVISQSHPDLVREMEQVLAPS